MLIFHERISIPTVLAIILTITGVVCVAQPTILFDKLDNTNTTMIKTNIIQSDKSVRLFGLCLALGCALSISASIVLNKKLLVLKIPQSVLMFQFSFLNLLILSINQIRNRFILHMYSNQTMFTWQYLIAALISILQLFSSTLTQKAIKLEHPSLISVVQSSDILFAILLQNIFTNEKSNWLVLIGSALVTTSIFLVGGYKLYHDHKKSSEETTNSK
jgi:drug/metabolite transporter (DMT)-like permease